MTEKVALQGMSESEIRRTRMFFETRPRVWTHGLRKNAVATRSYEKTLRITRRKPAPLRLAGSLRKLWALKFFGCQGDPGSLEAYKTCCAPLILERGGCSKVQQPLG